MEEEEKVELGDGCTHLKCCPVHIKIRNEGCKEEGEEESHVGLTEILHVTVETFNHRWLPL